MRRYILLFLIAVLIPITICNAKTKKQAEEVKSESVFGDTWTMPCQLYDTDEEFCASSAYTGPKDQLAEVQKNALLAAQEIIRLKMKHSYQGMVSEYSASIGNNAGNDVEHKMQSAGDRIIDVIVNETRQVCTEYSLDKFRVNMTCYIGIKISKTDTADRISKEISDNLTQEEKDRISFNEQEYRKQMEKSFKNQ